MIDFTQKGTKLPIIPVGTEFRTVCFPEFDKRKIKFIHNQRTSMVSYGIYSKDYILCESADYENHGGTNYFIIKLSTIERLAKEQGMYNTNNENMKVTLQQNGTVTVTDTETTTTLSKVTVDEICRLVKEDGEKVKLEAGNWYKSETYSNALYFITKIEDNKFYAYGCNGNGNWESECEWCDNLKEEIKDQKPYEATPETVGQYLINEFIRLGWNENCIVATDNKWILKGNIEFKFVPDKNILQLWSDYGKCLNSDNEQNYRSALNVFRDGKFATIIQPETITRAEAEKRYDVKITD